jgi:alpha-D-ribose 1-methylphosphonate 5-phosphate C-P lyase
MVELSVRACRRIYHDPDGSTSPASTDRTQGPILVFPFPFPFPLRFCAGNETLCNNVSGGILTVSVIESFSKKAHVYSDEAI